MLKFCFYLPAQIKEVQKFTGWTNKELGAVIGATEAQVAAFKKSPRFKGVVGQNLSYALEAIKDLYSLFYYNCGWFRREVHAVKMPVIPFVQAWEQPYKGKTPVCSLQKRLIRLAAVLGKTSGFQFFASDEFVDRAALKTVKGKPVKDPSDALRRYPKLFRLACYIAGMAKASVCELTKGENRATVYHSGISPVMDVCAVISRLIKEDKWNRQGMTEMISGNARKSYVDKAKSIIRNSKGRDWRPKLYEFLSASLERHKKMQNIAVS